MQHVLRFACRNGHVEVVKLLLADSRVDPSADNQLAIQWACEFQHVEVVKLLLADSRVDPSAYNQFPIRNTCEKGYVEIVKLLLADKRVDPSVDNQFPIRKACEREKEYVEVVKLLLAHQRVDIFGLPVPSSSDILALFLLRRLYRLQTEIQEPTLLEHCPVLADIQKIESQRKALLDYHLLSDLSHLCLEYVPDFFCHIDKPLISLVQPDSKFPRFSFGHLSTL
jgi:hypothetical protein